MKNAIDFNDNDSKYLKKFAFQHNEEYTELLLLLLLPKTICRRKKI